MQTDQETNQTSVIDAEWDSDEDETYHTLLKACNKAFSNGVSSADIYDILSKMDAKVGMMTRTAEYSRWFWTHVFLKRLFTASILTAVTTLGLFWFMLNFYDVTLWPLSELNESRCLLKSHPLIMQILRPESNCSFCQDYDNTGTPIVEFGSVPSMDEFKDFAYSSKPIIIRRMGRTDFNFKRLKRLFDAEPEALVVDHCQFLPFRSSFSSIKEVFDTMISNNASGSPWYIGWSNCHSAMQEKLRKIFPRPSFLPKGSVHSSIDWIFVGSPGFGAPMHLDFVKRPSWQAQLSSTKTWRLKPPPECEAQCRDNISFSISAGDMLFLDTNSWFHETMVSGLDISISIGSEYD